MDGLSVRRLIGRLVVTATAAVLVAGCAGSSTPAAPPATSSTVAAAPAPASPVAAAGSSTSAAVSAPVAPSSGVPAAAVVAVRSGPIGSYLTDGAGRTLYLFVSDKGATSSCSAACTKFWPPLTSSGAPTASGGANAALLGSFTRSDGSQQVTYAGHPLYYFLQDTAAGDLKGQGSDGFGAKWWILTPTGQPITASAAGS